MIKYSFAEVISKISNTDLVVRKDGWPLSQFVYVVDERTMPDPKIDGGYRIIKVNNHTPTEIWIQEEDKKEWVIGNS